MGFWKAAFRAVQDITSLGGTRRLRVARERLGLLLQRYGEVCRKLTEADVELVGLVADVKAHAAVSRERLLSAAQMLRYFGKIEATVTSAASASLLRSESKSLTLVRQSSLDEFMPTAVGAGAGAAAAATTWGAIQLFGHASTGVAISTLHGAAATSAGWAAIGGGSLAAGGGGIAAGHILLPGVGTAVAVAFSAITSYSEAHKVETECEQLQNANDKNTAALYLIRSDLKIAGDLKRRLIHEDKALVLAICEAKRTLFRFGFLSRVWRLLRYWANGSYYKAEEFNVVEKLETAVLRFVAAFERSS